MSGTALAVAVSYTVMTITKECVVAMHIPPIKGTARVTFKVVDGTEPTLSMPMLVANGQQIGIWRRGYDAEHGSRRSRAVDK